MTACPGPRSSLAEQCRTHACEAERQAALGRDPAMRAQLIGIAGKWRRLAQMLERLEGREAARPQEPRSFAPREGR